MICMCLPLSACCQGKWSVVPAIGEPTARHENAFVECNGKFYIIGGRRMNPVNVYDPQTNKWSEGSIPPLELHHFQAVTFHDKIYVIGAMTGKYTDEKPVENIYVYDPASHSWTKDAAIPSHRLRGSSGVVVYKDRFYIVCGIADGHNGDHKKWLDVFDPKTGKWQELTDAPRTRDHFQAVVIGDKLYAAGGRNTSKNTGQVFELVIPEIDVYDFKNNSWSTLPESANIPTMRAGCSAVNFNNKLVVIGGESAQAVAHNEVEVLDVKKKKWGNYSPLVRGRYGTQAFVWNNRIYTATGSGNQGGGPELTTLEVFE